MESKQKNRVKLNICSQELIILSEDNIEYIKKVGACVDKRIEALAKTNYNSPIFTSAILSALQFCDEGFKLENENTALKQKLKRANEEKEELKDKLFEAAKSNTQMSKELSELKKHTAKPDSGQASTKQNTDKRK